MKNTESIDKIISELAMKDYLRANPRKKNGRPKYKTHHPYTLSFETNEARGIRQDYCKGRISEEAYKGYCLRYRLTTKNS